MTTTIGEIAATMSTDAWALADWARDAIDLLLRDLHHYGYLTDMLDLFVPSMSLAS